MVGNAGEGKPDSHGSKAIDTAESRVGVGAITIASLPHTHQYWQLNNREAGSSNTCHSELQSKTPPRLPFTTLMH